MIIVSQGKNVILNFDNVSTIAIDDNKTNKKIYARCNNDDIVGLGKYESEERTIEVLQEIIESYRDYICYEMPEK